MTYATVQYKHLTLSKFIGLPEHVHIGACKRDKVQSAVSEEREGFVGVLPSQGLDMYHLGKRIWDNWRANTTSMGQIDLNCIAYDFWTWIGFGLGQLLC